MTAPVRRWSLISARYARVTATTWWSTVMDAPTSATSEPAMGWARRPTVLAMVDPDGTVAAVADDMHFPNGMVLTEDGSTLIVAESNAQRLTEFRVSDDGSLHDRAVFASLGDVRPDGICLDA